ncbi:S-layer homology domain-containing protein [Cytobacillus massiliigabonensis]|uniref:S-layer homology domain-containing protein n=1 Tax=Cytobacillus massiliigabonensis TaxID=1871011 RepID=UPI0015E0D2DC|nr:S-layer homology domain-containing protein [Cytobacillus massiliigabonensis]
MRKGILLFILVLAVSLHVRSEVQADVVDESSGMNVRYQVDGEETQLKPVATFKGKSGVEFISYSKPWKDSAKLAALEEELLKNKHGEELQKLGKIMIYPDYPAGKQVQGQYFAKYKFAGGEGQLYPDRIIHLYGGDDQTSVSSLARTLSHEYGHHMTFYLLIEGEDLPPDEWITSKYGKARELSKYPQVHMNGKGAYEGYLPEVLAEDYVQLLGSEEAVKKMAQYNGSLPTPFDLPSIQDYWGEMLPNGFERENPLALKLTDFKQTYSNAWDLLMETDSKTANHAYLTGQPMNEFYQPVQLGTLGGTKLKNWYSFNQFPTTVSWIFSIKIEGAHFRLLQHEDDGFNKGSKTLSVSYKDVAASQTAAVEMEEETALESKQSANEELSMIKKKELLSAAAKKYKIPAEVLKAIAYNESGMNQFKKDGTPLITDDGGMGIMQVTLTDEEMAAKGITKEKLISDTAYNIEVGAQILQEKWKWTFIPRINDHNPEIIEHWYFAIMAYNGLSKRNDPNNDLGATPYQEKIFKIIEDNSLVSLTAIPSFKVNYADPARPEIMSFPKDQLQYEWKGMDTKTSHLYQKGDAVYTWNDMQSTSNVRDKVDGNRIASLPHFTPLTIVSGPYESANANNHFVYYEVKGAKVSGYIASSLIHKGTVTVFKDINREEVREAVAYLQVRNILNGYPDGNFHPNEPILRRHAAAMLVKELGLTLPDGYKSNAKDMKPGDLGYQAMVIAEANGLIGQGGELRPNEHVSRAQMASLLVRAYEAKLAKPTTKAKFTDIDESFWNYADINTLAYNEITVRDAYGPSDSVTRSQFALFLKRILDR